MPQPVCALLFGACMSNATAEAECRDRFMVLFNFRYAHYFEFLGGRTSNKGKARLRCKVCGHEFERFGNFARMDANLFCPRCHVHRDDVITVPIDGRLAEHLSEMYASGIGLERLAEETGISSRYIRSLVTDESIAAHDEAVQRANEEHSANCKELREAKREQRARERAAVADMFSGARSELSEAKADKVLKSATAHVAKDFKRFGDVSDFITTYAPSHATCNHCGKDYLFFPSIKKFGRKQPNKYCSTKCSRKENKQSSHICKRLGRHGREHEYRDRITLNEVIERDNGVCYICGCKTDKADRYYVRGRWFTAGDSYPTIEHVIPIARGGTHTWDNVRLACHKCNREKRDRTQGVWTSNLERPSTLHTPGRPQRFPSDGILKTR